MRSLAILRSKHFSILWLGLCLSCVGDYFYLIAIMWTAAKLAGSGAGLVAACQSGAAMVVAPLAGALADRLDRRRLMIAADLGRAACVAILAGLAAGGHLGMTPMVIVALALGSLGSLFTPALFATIPAIIERDDQLQAANALVDSTRRIARAVGPSLAGAAAAAMSIASFFAIDAFSFCASAIAIFLIRPRAARQETAPVSGVLWMARGIRETVGVVRAHAGASWALATLFVSNATWCAGFQVGAVLLASRELGMGIGGYSLLVGAYGAGNVVGNLVVSSVEIKRRPLAIYGSKLVFGAGFLVMAAAPSVAVAMAGAVIAAIGGPLGELPTVAMLQTEFAPDQRGRVFGLYLTAQQTGVAAGLLLAAPIFAVAPTRYAIASCAIALGASGIAGMARFGIRA